MSVNIMWQPKAPRKGRDLGTWTPSSLIELLKNQKGNMPCDLDAGDIEWLRETDRNDCTHLANILAEYGEITVWVEG